MVLFHILAKAHAGNQNQNTFRVEIPNEIPGQVFVLKKSVVAQEVQLGQATTHTGTHTVLARLDRILSQHECNSNHSSNDIPLSFDWRENRTESDYHINIKLEKVPRVFDIAFYKPTVDATTGVVGSEPMNFHTTATNHLRCVELWFEYADNVAHHRM